MKIKFIPFLFFGLITVNGQQAKNIIKTNLTGYIFRNLNVTYERSINRTFTISLGLSTVTKGDIPLVKDYFGDDVKQDFKDINMSSTAITIEPRVYFGKKYNSGFYLAPYYRYTKMKFEHFVYDFKYTRTDNTRRDIPLDMTGDVSANSFGLMMGAQWYFGKNKNWVIDWWIVGGHYGFSSGNLNGASSVLMDQEDQDALIKDVNSIEIPIIDYKAEANAGGLKVKLDGPWAGLRSGISFGYRF